MSDLTEANEEFLRKYEEEFMNRNNLGPGPAGLPNEELEMLHLQELADHEEYKERQKLKKLILSMKKREDTLIIED